MSGAGPPGSHDLGRVRAVYVSAGAQTLRQFRLPLLRRQARRFARLVLYIPEDPPHTQLLRDEGLEVRVGPVGTRPGPGTLLEIARLARYLRREGFDVLIGHQPMGSLIGIAAAILAGVPVRIYSTGGLKSVPGRRDLWNRLMGVGESRLIAAADAVLLVNREDEEHLGADPRTREKAIYVGPRGGCGIDTGRFSPERRQEARAAARRELAAGGEDFLVGTSGRLVWEKGFRQLVAAATLLCDWPELPPLRFVVLGAGRDLAGIRSLVEAAGLGPRFAFLGYRLDIEHWLSALDLFVLASEREGMPMALLEGMAMGLPAVATDIRGSRELIRHGESGVLVGGDDPEALAAAIAEVALSPERGRAMGSTAAAEVAARYAESVLLDRTVAVIEEVIARWLESRPARPGRRPS